VKATPAFTAELCTFDEAYGPGRMTSTDRGPADTFRRGRDTPTRLGHLD